MSDNGLAAGARPTRLGAVRGPTLATDAGLRASYRAHAGELFRFALRSLGDRGLAEEAVQETFVRAWRAADRFDPDLSSLRTWLFAIARNVVIDLSRTRAARPPLARTEPADEPEVGEDPIERALAAWQVEEALRRISADHRTALVETYYRARPYTEVAAELGIPEGTLRSRVYYGLRALRLALEEMGWGG
jgi:RNA polymerase sigma-70 factor (ECF subfamily)